MIGWLIDIIPTERPSDVMDAPEAYRAAWGRYVGEVVPGDGDPEDWREQAARLEAATRILPDPHVRVAGRPYEGPDPMTLAHYGVVRIRPYMDQLTLPASNVDRWLDEHWDDPAEKKRLQYRANAIADPKRLPDRWIQACLWTITPHDVVDIRPACGKPDTIGNHG